jgi:hypothetical protein
MLSDGVCYVFFKYHLVHLKSVGQIAARKRDFNL